MAKMMHIDDLHKFFAGGSVAAFIGGIGIALRDDRIDFECVYLAMICVLMRSKFWIDDREYFIKVENGDYKSGLGFKIGVVLGYLSWIPWIIAGLVVGREQVCAGVMVVVFVISTLWIMSTWLDQRPYSAQIGWMFYNAVYGGGFFMLAARKAHWFPLPDHRQIVVYFVETVMLIIFLMDATASGTLVALSRLSGEEKDKAPPATMT